MIKKWISIFLYFKKAILQNKINIYSASTAFFLFLSVVPILVLTILFLPHLFLEEQKFEEGIRSLMPAPVAAFLFTMMKEAYEKSIQKISYAVLLALWSAGRGMYFLSKGLNEIHHIKEQRNYIAQRIIASFYTFILLLILLFSLSAEFLHLPLLFSFLVLALVIASIYTVVPDKKISFSTQLPGAVIASLAWHVYSYAFSAYLEYGLGFGTYGSISVIVIFMMWLYFDIYIILLGAILNEWMVKRKP